MAQFVFRAILLCGLASYAGLAFGSGFDRMSEDQLILERLVPGPLRAGGSRAAFQIAFARSNAPAALEAAREAVRHDPVHPSSTSSLGSAYQMTGDLSDSDRAFRVAALFGWRDNLTQSYWYGVAVGAGDMRVAADRADAMLRTQPRIAEGQFPFAELEDTSEGRSELARMIARKPDWMDRYFVLQGERDPVTLDRKLAVGLALPTGRGNEFCSAIRNLAMILISEGRYADAAQVWNRNCPANRAEGPMTDLSFSAVGTTAGGNLPFSWRLEQSGDLRVRVAQTSSGRAISFSNAATYSRVMLSQVVSFPPGRYLFKVTGNSGPSTPGTSEVTASLDCGKSSRLPSPAEGNLTGDGQMLEVGGCSHQLFALWLGGGDKAEITHISFEKID